MTARRIILTEGKNWQFKSEIQEGTSSKKVKTNNHMSTSGSLIVGANNF